MTNSEDTSPQLEELFAQVNQQLDELAKRQEEVEQISKQIDNVVRRQQALEDRIRGPQPLHQQPGYGGPFGQPGAYVQRPGVSFPNAPLRSPQRGHSEIQTIRIDVVDNDDEYRVKADVEGYTRDEISLQIAGRALHIRATRDENGVETRYLLRERHRPKARAVPFPGPIDVEAVAATIKDGILTVSLPKSGSTDTSQSIDIE